MKQINSILSPTNSQESLNRAQNSNRAAKVARTARDKRNFILQVLEDWARIFTNSPIGILTTLFFFAVLMEIIFSFPMYLDLMSEMTGKGNVLLALIGAFFIVLWGAYVSHLVAKKMSHSVYNFTVYNEIKFSKNAMPQAAAEEEARTATRRDLIKGLLLGLLLLFVVAAISWQRVWLLSAISGSDYSLTQKLLPVVCVLIEIISGIYIGYLIRKFREAYKARKLNKEYIREKDLCAYETAMTHEHYQHAIRNNEEVHYSKELGDALYRYEHRAQEDENYIEPTPMQKSLKVVVADEVGFVPGVHLAGLLGNGEYCNTIWTNEQGEGVLRWEGEAKEVRIVYTDNEQHLGPFRENSTIRIDLKRPKQLASP